MHFTDPYTFRAHFQPALTAVLPLGFLMLALLPGHPFFVVAFFGLLSTAGGAAAVSQMGRDRGRRKEPALWEGWGGPPTTRLLRHRSPPNIRISDSLRQQLERLIGYSLPSEQQELETAGDADSRYEEAVGFLREATRDTAKFPLVFAENANYGYRRNLWGLKPYGLSIAFLAALGSWALVFHSLGFSCPDSWLGTVIKLDKVVTLRLVVAFTNTALVFFWLFWAKPSWIKVVADAYARRLLESVQTLSDNTPGGLRGA